MAVRITCINKSGGYHENPHEAISHYGWINEINNDSGKSDRLTMVRWVENGGIAYVVDSLRNKVYCKVRISLLGNKFLQTETDGRPTNNLLQLPEC